MKKCSLFSTNEAGRKYCARFDNVDDDIAVVKQDEQKLGYFDIGEVTKAMGALGGIGLSDIIPPLVGGTAAVLTTLLIRKFVKNPESIILRFAPVGGILGGVLASIPLYWLYGKAGVIKGALGGAVVGGGLLAFDKLKDSTIFSGMGLLNVQRRMRGVGTLVSAGGSSRALQSAKVPSGIGSAMDVGAFASKATY